jgi:hypothetical protein
MAQTSWPFENIDTSETQYSQLFRNLGEGPIDGKGFELEPYADSTGMNVKVKSGQALVRGHYYDSTGTETILIPAADATNPRIDRVVLRLNPTTNAILLTLIQGTPAASPSAPALTQTDGAIYDLPLAQVYVAANETIIEPADVTDQRTIFAPWTGSVAISGVTGLTSALAAKQDVVSGVSNTEISYLDGVTSAIQTQLNSKLDAVTPIFTRNSGHTLAVGDTNDMVLANGTFTITVPANTFTAGVRVDVVNIGTGIITFAGSGLTIQSKDAKLTIGKQFAAATLFFTSATNAILIGDLA